MDTTEYELAQLNKELMDTIRLLRIPYKIVEHPPATTTEEADAFIDGHQGVRTKNLFLTNKRKSAFFLIVMDDKKRLDIHHFKNLIGSQSRIKLTSSETAIKKMKLPPGLISIFGLPYNADKDVQVFFDQEILEEEYLTFHPNINTQTIFLKKADTLELIKHYGYDIQVIAL
ncbi:YbaK/EbsC family protein [Vagococcus zengguangii]|uniref:Prolyl-tRNA synthetase associated domain-containing protein n=1 Tax=Vagococcus zengguangii TaxID=2571750 RepID=A0A4D7CQC6_9ENTE|nr:YbaK/EbsC family protein [Vagococcus zengguangii]QCI86298.1 prolyl-tRNA synthetase associated domain-containing protein [Vagococcus zengguangii]TLG81431.1 prolyl-tRNA synthetase associated domain-containing protein [Vagococcus zengguangii]